MDLTYLITQIKAANSTGLRLRQGQVVTINTSPNSVDISIAGDTNILPYVKYLASYSPTTSDTVWLLSNGADLIVIGKQA